MASMWTRKTIRWSMRPFRFAASVFFVSLALVGTTAVQACGTESDCEIGEHDYRIYLPERSGKTATMGAIVYAHGYRGNSERVINNDSLRRVADELGVALIAANAVGDDWSIPGSPQDMDASGDTEYDYYDALLADVTQRFAIDRQRMVMVGFSAGGMMVWSMACNRGDRFAAFVPMSGTFWNPVPDECPSGAVNLIHIHGTSDRVVPIAGRAIQKTRQGDVMKAIDLAIRTGRFGAPQDVRALNLSCERRTNAGGNLLELCLHPGGHVFKADYIIRAWHIFEEAGQL